MSWPLTEKDLCACGDNLSVSAIVVRLVEFLGGQIKLLHSSG